VPLSAAPRCQSRHPTHPQTHTDTHQIVHMAVLVGVCVLLSLSLCVYVCMYVCVYVCVCGCAFAPTYCLASCSIWYPGAGSFESPSTRAKRSRQLPTAMSIVSPNTRYLHTHVPSQSHRHADSEAQRQARSHTHIDRDGYRGTWSAVYARGHAYANDTTATHSTA
jgi:hypothetical protein